MTAYKIPLGTAMIEIPVEEYEALIEDRACNKTALNYCKEIINVKKEKPYSSGIDENILAIMLGGLDAQEEEGKAADDTEEAEEDG